MLKKIICISMICVFIMGVVQITNAAVITFEDLYPGQEFVDSIPDNYAGFIWSADAWWVTKGLLPSTGIEYGTIGNVSLVTAYEEDISMEDGYFDFNGVYITSAWKDGQDVTVEGWRDGGEVYSTTIVTSHDGPYWYDFDFLNVDEIWFKPGEQGTDAGLGQISRMIVIDDITYNETAPVPEPMSIFLFFTGFIFWAGLKKRSAIN